MCYNEQVLLPRTIRHYRRLLPGCKIVVCDNESSDSSVQIANALECNVHGFATGDAIDEHALVALKNGVWKSIRTGWVVVCDMDEYLCINAAQLSREDARGTTVLRTEGFEIVGTSASPTLEDVDIANFDQGYASPWFSKNVCFRSESVTEIHYAPGSHTCQPTGDIIFSQAAYPVYHMNCLGLPYFIAKQRVRYERAREMQRIGLSTHYTDDEAELTSRHRRKLAKAQPVPSLASVYRAFIP